MIKPYLMAAAFAAMLAACGTDVKLDEPPVSDATATTGGAGAAGQGAGQSAVTQVQADGAGQDRGGPAGVGKVVYFDYDSFVVKPEFQSVIDGQARHLQANRGRQVVLEGHTDERGGREYNLALGQKRAEAVRRALTLVGAPDAQIEAVSFGEEQPAASGASEDAYARNRRVEFKYR